MTNPLIHALVFLAAVLIPGGLLVYFAWRAISLKGKPNHTAQIPDKEDISDTARPSPDEARLAFQEMFPKDSLRAQSLKGPADRVRAFRHRKIKK